MSLFFFLPHGNRQLSGIAEPVDYLFYFDRELSVAPVGPELHEVRRVHAYEEVDCSRGVVLAGGDEAESGDVGLPVDLAHGASVDAAEEPLGAHVVGDVVDEDAVLGRDHDDRGGEDAQIEACTFWNGVPDSEAHFCLGQLVVDGYGEFCYVVNACVEVFGFERQGAGALEVFGEHGGWGEKFPRIWLLLNVFSFLFSITAFFLA